MAATFVEIGAERIEALMAEAGFTEIDLPNCGERVFVRQHHVYANVQIRVYTSLNKCGGHLRQVGEDRMMVTAFWTGGASGGYKDASRFLFGAKGVNRASGEADASTAERAVLDRLLVRMREVYKQVNQARRCPRCHQPLRSAKSGKKGTPNFGRPYVSCLTEKCGFFAWDDKTVHG
jgi:hypothetical protein